MYNSIKKHLHKSGIRLTPARESVIRVMIRHKMPLTVAQIIGYAKHDADMATFYRTIKSFVDAGIIKEVESNNIIKYELSELFLPHHHHLTCLSCGKIEDIADHNVESAVEQIAKSYGFRIESHVFELKGVCNDCN